jgi:hypothetical protein
VRLGWRKITGVIEYALYPDGQMCITATVL